VLPTTFVGVLVLLAVVTPGILLELLRQRVWPTRNDTIFLETSRVLAAGVLLSAIGVLLMSVVAVVSPRAITDLHSAIVDPLYLANHLLLALSSIVLFLTLTATLAGIYSSIFLYPGISGPIAQESAWVSVFARLLDRLRREQVDELAGRTITTQVQVELKSGSVFIGTRDVYTVNAAMEGRELVLASPLFQVDAGGRIVALEAGWQRLIIAQSEIAMIRVRFAADASKVEPAAKESSSARARRKLDGLLSSPRWLAALLTAELLFPVLLGRIF
jgi:hypothetical protein